MTDLSLTSPRGLWLCVTGAYALEMLPTGP